MVKSVETYNRNYARKCVMAFLDGRKNINWVLGTIRYSKVHEQILKEVLENLKDYGRSDRYQEVLSACREQGWL